MENKEMRLKKQPKNVRLVLKALAKGGLTNDRVRVVKVGPYQNYEVKGKYGKNDMTQGLMIFIPDDALNNFDSFSTRN